MTLKQAFDEGAWAAQQANPDQIPWLDDTGDGVANGPADGALAAGRSLACTDISLDKWPPDLDKLQVKRLDLTTGHGEIWVQARDDKGVKRVWAEIYAPSYQPPTEPEEIADPHFQDLFAPQGGSQGGDWYALRYTLFHEKGPYRIVVYAEDQEGLIARPKEIIVSTRSGEAVYVPLILK